MRATPENILWGSLPNAAATPVLTVDAGATVTVDTLSHEGLLEDQGRDPIATSHPTMSIDEGSSTMRSIC